MTELMQREMQEIFYMFYGGLSIMMVFLVRDTLVQRCRKYQRVKGFLYLFFWVVAAFLFCQFLYQGAYGVISWYGLLAFGSGIILWKKVFCGILNLNYNVHKSIGNTENEEENKRASKKIPRRKNRLQPTTEKTKRAIW